MNVNYFLRDVSLPFRFDLVAQTGLGSLALGHRRFQLLAETQSRFGGLT